MNRSERRELHRTLERRVFAGERKADIVGQAAGDGQDWRAIARTVALIPTPSRRHRWRWLNRLLMAVLVVAAACQVASALLVEGDWFWLVAVLTWAFFFLLPLPWIVLYRQRGYALAMTAGVIALGWWLYVVAWGHEAPASGTLMAGAAALCLLTIVLSLATQRLLLPATTIWTDVRPKTDAAGNLVFEE
jgi:hypothetical protein